MPKMSYSLGVAIGVHLLIVTSLALLIHKGPTTVFIDDKNLINVQVGKTSPSSPAAKVVKTSKKSINFTSGTSANTSTTLAGEKGEAFNGNDSLTFTESVSNYREPLYPKLAIKRGLEGTVRIKMQISAEGMLEKVEILKSSGHELLDKSVIEATGQWKFQKKNTPYFLEKNILFQLKT